MVVVIPTVQMGTEIQRGARFPRPREPEKQCLHSVLRGGGFIHTPLPTNLGGPSISEPQFPCLSPSTCSGRQCPGPVSPPMSFQRPYTTPPATVPHTRVSGKGAQRDVRKGPPSPPVTPAPRPEVPECRGVAGSWTGASALQDLGWALTVLGAACLGWWERDAGRGWGWWS